MPVLCWNFRRVFTILRFHLPILYGCSNSILPESNLGPTGYKPHVLTIKLWLPQYWVVFVRHRSNCGQMLFLPILDSNPGPTGYKPNALTIKPLVLSIHFYIILHYSSSLGHGSHNTMIVSVKNSSSCGQMLFLPILDSNPGPTGYKLDALTIKPPMLPKYLCIILHQQLAFI